MVLSRIYWVVLANLAVAALVYFSTSTRDAETPMQMSETAYQGQSIWRQRQCVSCHSLYGLGGHMGPDLTNVLARKGEEYSRIVLQQGIAKMPAQHFSPLELEHLFAFLRHIQGTGVYPLDSLVNHSFGQTHE